MTPTPLIDSCTGRALLLLKAICVAGMVAVHAFYWAATQNGRIPVNDTSSLLWIVRHGMVLGVLPLLLPFTAGAALRLSRTGRDGRPLPVSILHACLLALAFAAAGYLMNVLAGGSFAAKAWNVLQFAGLSLVVIALLDRLGGSVAIALAAWLVLASSDPLRNTIPFYAGPGWMRILLGDPTDYHTWPFFPWFSTVAFGWLVAYGALRFRDAVWFRVALFATGVLAAAYAFQAGRLLPHFDRLNLIGPRVMQPPAAAVAGIIGWASLLLSALAVIAPKIQISRYGWVHSFSSGILLIYVTHMIAGARAARLLFSFADQQRILAEPASPQALLVLLGFPAFLLVLSRFTGLAALRWLSDKQIRIQVRRTERRVMKQEFAL